MTLDTSKEFEREEYSQTALAYPRQPAPDVPLKQSSPLPDYILLPDYALSDRLAQSATPPPSSKVVGIGLTLAVHLLLFIAFFTARIESAPNFSKPDSMVLMQLLSVPSETPPAPRSPPLTLPNAPELTETEPAKQPNTEQKLQEPAIAPSVSPALAPVHPEVTSLPASETSKSAMPPQPTAPVSTSIENSFHGRVLAHIQRFRQYPPAARARRQEGNIRIQFTMDRDGTVIHQAVLTSSGVPLLDREALNTMQRAQPLPAIPHDLPAPQELVVTISFSMKNQ